MVRYTRPSGDAARATLLKYFQQMRDPRAPTIQEIAAALSWRPRRVQHHLKVLVEQGAITHRAGARGYMLAEPSKLPGGAQ